LSLKIGIKSFSQLMKLNFPKDLGYLQRFDC
jgi:hypothetical protein